MPDVGPSRPAAGSRGCRRPTPGGVRIVVPGRLLGLGAVRRRLRHRAPAGSRRARGAGEPVHAGRTGRRRSGSKTSAICSLSSVSFSSSSVTSVVEDVAVLDQDVEGLLVRGREELLGLLVDDRGDVLGVVAGVAEVAAHERLAVALAELDRAEPLGHAVLRDHRAGQRGGLLDVVAGAGGRVVEDHLLGGPAAEHVGELVEHLRAGLGVLVLVGQHHRVAQGPAARQDRDLVHRVGARQRRGHQGVAALVVGRDELLLLAHQAGALLRAGDDAVDRLVEVARRRSSCGCRAR